VDVETMLAAPARRTTICGMDVTLEVSTEGQASRKEEAIGYVGHFPIRQVSSCCNMDSLYTFDS
jgi:hypothetical protein